MLGTFPVIEILFLIIVLYEKIAHDAFFQNMVMAPSSIALCPNYFVYTFNTLALSVLKGRPDSFKT